MLLSEDRRSNIENNEDETKDPTASFYEQEAFYSIWDGLRWSQIRKRVPICARKSIRSRYLLANIVYFSYTIGILVIDFNPTINTFPPDEHFSNETQTTTMSTDILDQPAGNTPYVNRLYVGFGIVHALSAILYLVAWRDRSWMDIILIPEYLNQIEAVLYLWSAIWYSKQDTLGSYYTLAIHQIELAAATVEVVACFGWIGSWYMTYVRTLGRGFTLDDPDTIASLTTLAASIMYFVYNIQISISPELYATNFLYTQADILYFVGSCYYLFAALRDDHWFWYLPFAGQYGVAPGKVQIETTKTLPCYGKPAILMSDVCRRRGRQTRSQSVPRVRFRSTSSDLHIISDHI